MQTPTSHPAARTHRLGRLPAPPATAVAAGGFQNSDVFLQICLHMTGNGSRHHCSGTSLTTNSGRLPPAPCPASPPLIGLQRPRGQRAHWTISWPFPALFQVQFWLPGFHTHTLGGPGMPCLPGPAQGTRLCKTVLLIMTFGLHSGFPCVFPLQGRECVDGLHEL